MPINMNKLFNAKSVKITEDTSEVDEILEQEEILYTISESLVNYRKEKNLTQKDLAEKLNVNQTMISKLESGNYNPTFKLIHKLCRKLSKSPEMFIRILEKMISNVKRITNATYEIKIIEKEFMQYEYKLDRSDDKKVIQMYKYNSEGDNVYEQYTSTIKNIG